MADVGAPIEAFEMCKSAVCNTVIQPTIGEVHINRA